MTGKPAPKLDRLGILEVSLRAQNRWMRNQGGVRWRFDTFTFRPKGRKRRVRAVDVTFVPSRRPSSQMRTLADVKALLQARGLDRPNKRYLAYVAADAGSVCGEAEYPLTPGGRGRFAAVFLYSAAGCGTRAFARKASSPSWSEAVALHESLHNEGAVPLTAPRSCPTSPATCARRS